MTRLHNLFAIGIVLTLSLTNLYPAKAADDVEKYEVIYELFEVTGLQHNMITLTQDLITKELRRRLKDHPKITEADLQTITKIVNDTFEERSGEVLQPIAKLYAKEFSTEELQSILIFQKSPAGKKASRLMPSLIQQGMVLGQTWGQDVGQTAVQRIKQHFADKGIDI